MIRARPSPFLQREIFGEVKYKLEQNSFTIKEFEKSLRREIL